MEIHSSDPAIELERILLLRDNDNENNNVYRFYGETIAFTVFLIIGLITNGPLLLVYLRSKHIRSAVDKFLFNMLIADTICVVVLIPTILSDLVLPDEVKELDLSIQYAGSSSGNSVGASALIGHVTPNLIQNDLSQLNVSEDKISSTFSIRNINVIQQTVVNVLLSKNMSSKSNWSCSFKKSLLTGVSTASILASLEIAVERYLAVVNPLHYHEFLTKTGVVLTSTIGSLIAICSAILSSLDPCQPVFPSCIKNTSSVTDSIWWPSYTLVHVSLFFIIPILLMTFIYVKIWWEARRQRAKMSSQYKRPFFVDVPNYGNGEHPVTGRTDSVEEGRRAKRFYLHPILLRFKLIERLVAPRMDRAARVAVCTLFVTILCWGPYYFVETSHALQSMVNETNGNKAWHHYEAILPLFFASLHPIIAPFFYAYRYKRVREEVLKACYLETCFHKNRCAGLTPRKSIVLEFHDTHMNSSASKTNHILTPVSSEIGLHACMTDPIHFYSPPSSPKLPKFHIGPALDVENDIIGCDSGLRSIDYSHHSIPVINGLKSSQLSLCNEKVTPKSRGFAASLVHSLSVWLVSYSARWRSHRESVTSTSSVVTLLTGATQPPTISITHEGHPPFSHV